ncbi:MAG: hypothetical protein QGG40_15010, partial [Myxococcota bacterium]|nr:hypothetical protein [Myxococcota bacterium]
MTVKVGQVVDEVALGVMARLWLSDGGLDLDHQQQERERVLELYGGGRAISDPMAFFPEPPVPSVEARFRRPLRSGRVERLRWLSGYRTWDPDYQEEYDDYQRNRMVHAEHWRHDQAGRTTMVVLHSWMTGHYGLQRHIFQVQRLYRAGLDVVIV